MLSLLRVLNAAVIARGRSNEQTIFAARDFLSNSRNSMVAIFKRSVNVGIGGLQGGFNSRLGRDEAVDEKEVARRREDLAELVDCWTVMVEVTGFLEVCLHLV